MNKIKYTGERICFLIAAIERLSCAESERIYQYGKRVLNDYSERFD